MTRWIGTVAFGDMESSAIKRAALLFDMLAATRVDERGELTYVDRLIEAGIVGIRVPVTASLTIEVEEADYRANIELDDIQIAQLIRDRLIDDVATRSSVPVKTPTTDSIHDNISHFLSEEVRKRFPHDAVVPLLSRLRVMETGSTVPILRVILQQVPMPDRSTPWEAIRDFRNDNEARAKQRRLKAWIARMSRENIPPCELEDAVPSMVDDYTQYMSVQHSKIRRGIWEIALVTTAGLLDDVLHFRFADAAERLVALSATELRIAEQELSAPGREVAYMAETAKRFSIS